MIHSNIMQVKENFTEFRKDIMDKGIEHLVHFTPTINLISIFEQGKLLSRARLEQFDIKKTDIFDYVTFPDSLRFDDKNFINLSVQHPNAYLFQIFRKRFQADFFINWCVLKIDSKYIYEKNTLFSVTNAANSHNKINAKVSGDILKFRMMFSPTLDIVTSNNCRQLERNNLPLKYPTDEQAEVLVKDEILIADISEVCFENKYDLAAAKAALSDYNTSNFVIDTTLFSNLRL